MIKQEVEFTTNTSDVRVSRKLSNALQQWQRATLQKLQQEPGKPKYPIRWTSERQRRKFFASKGFGRGIPTRRTHQLSQSWDVTVNINQITRWEAFVAELTIFLAKFGVGSPPQAPAPSIWISVSNPVEYEQYVTGVNQQGFHHDTGWYSAPTVINTAFQQAEGIIDGL